MPNPKKTLEFKFERTIPASPDEVFDGWLSPKIPGTTWNAAEKFILAIKVSLSHRAQKVRVMVQLIRMTRSKRARKESDTFHRVKLFRGADHWHETKTRNDRGEDDF